jgi:hypothetical protein
MRAQLNAFAGRGLVVGLFLHSPSWLLELLLLRTLPTQNAWINEAALSIWCRHSSSLESSGVVDWDLTAWVPSGSRVGCVGGEMVEAVPSGSRVGCVGGEIIEAGGEPFGGRGITGAAGMLEA